MLPNLQTVRVQWASISVALLTLTLACDVPDPEISIKILASEDVIDGTTYTVIFAVQVTQTFMGEVLPLEGAEVVFSGECVLDHGTMEIAESDPIATDENGIAAVGLEIPGILARMPSDKGKWRQLITLAQVLGSSASVTLELPVDIDDNGAERFNQGSLKPGKLWVP